MTAEVVVRIDEAAFERLTERKIRNGLIEAGVVGEGLVKIDLSGTGSGKEYTRNGRTKRRSAPGEHPVVDSGDLRRGIGHEVRIGRNRATSTITSRMEYSEALEAGKGKLRGPRPILKQLGTKHLSALVSAFKRGARR